MMLALISPAKSLDFSSPLVTTRFTQPELLACSSQIMDELKQLSPPMLASLMKLSDKLSALNFERNQAWQPPFTPDNARAAVLAFNGDVYGGLQANTFSDSDFDYAQTHLRILSGLYGVLRPLDLIQPYRLEMGTRLAVDGAKDLYAFWKEQVTARINQSLFDQGDEVVVNLASNEYWSVVDKKALKAKVITPVFKDYKNGQYKVISFFAKKARGMMLHEMIKHRWDSIGHLTQFSCDGYCFCETESSETELVFKRQGSGA